jgi:hypothetical protein
MKEQLLKLLSTRSAVAGIMTIVAGLLIYDEISDHMASTSRWYYHGDGAINLDMSKNISSEVLLTVFVKGYEEGYNSERIFQDTLYEGALSPNMINEVTEELSSFPGTLYFEKTKDYYNRNPRSAHYAIIEIDGYEVELSQFPDDQATKEEVILLVEDWWDSYEPIYNYIKKNQAF